MMDLQTFMVLWSGDQKHQEMQITEKENNWEETGMHS